MRQSLLLFAAIGAAEDPLRPYPLPDAHLKTTSILDHAGYLSGFDDAQWYLDNIPFVDFPDQSLQDVYYYRASVIKRHLKYAHENHGFMFTEFIHPVTWASKLQTIPDSAGHHILESRWLRDPNYAKDLILAYTRGGTEALSGISYTHYVQRAILEHAQTTGDAAFLTAQLEGMIATFNLWDVQFDNTTGLYHRTPLSDAQEYSLPGYIVGGPNGGPVKQWNDAENDFNTIFLGPETYRPSHNAYMIANARAIAAVARLAGNASLAQQWSARAATLEQNMHSLLWDNDLQFWIDVVRGSNTPAVGRQLIGYFPYRFDVFASSSSSNSFTPSNAEIRGLEAGLSPEAFLTEFGPTTLEQSNPYYTALKNSTICCVWNGQSWPFSTGVYLGTLARIARANLSDVITKDFWISEFEKYARTNYRGGVPYTAESHYPTLNQWSGDNANHSEHYLHSTFLDNVFTNLLGIIPTLDDRLELRPLVPDNWTHFAVENLPYHGSLLTLLWDSDGTHYSTSTHSAGLSIFHNGALLHTQPTLTALNLTLPNSTLAVRTLAAAPRYANILANPNTPWSLPSITANYELNPDGNLISTPAWKLNDGLLWYDEVPDNRWTNNQSTTPFNTLTVTLPRPRKLSSISLAIYADVDKKGGLAGGGVIACPARVIVKDARSNAVLAERGGGGVAEWSTCVPNALNTIAFDAGASSTDSLTVTLWNRVHYAVALSEVQLWVPEEASSSSSSSSSPKEGGETETQTQTQTTRYELEDGLIGAFVGSFQGTAYGINGSVTALNNSTGVALHTDGWVEVAGVTGGASASASGKLGIVGAGPGAVRVRLNWVGEEHVVRWDGDAVVEREVSGARLAPGRNFVTVFWKEGTPWVDALVVV
ncbi:Six-hairpin glycosidase-like protein [Phyllosticta paracitricarpa]|uniref:Six-hairpin glycosidase-like protein n=1 Tax=Phyllosticta paracitricarpa TaxID=2016321 RepID=A0ABR1MVY8_9PEZI